MASSRIEELASAIGNNTGRVAAYLRENGLPFPSFDPEGPVDPTLKDGQLDWARQQAIMDCMELIDLLQGPQMCLRPCYNAAPIHTIYKFNIAEKVPLSGTISFSSLARAAGLYEPDLRRIIRYAILYHRCFQEPVRGFVGHSAASLQLAQNADVRDGVGLMFDDFYPSFARTAEALALYAGEEPSPARSGWGLTHGGEGIFDSFARQPWRAQRFSGAMKFFSATVPGNNPALLADAYPWAAALRPGSTLVDVGGADGYVSVLLARRLPEALLAKVVVQDLPHVAAAGRVPAELAGRMEFQAQDMFEPQAVRGADVYLLRWILHDWADGYALRILRALAPALKKGAKVLINDNVGPGQSGSLPLLPERFVRELDAIMLSAFNSYERELEDWERLVREADPRFGPVRYIQIPGALLGILEVEWLG